MRLIDMHCDTLYECYQKKCGLRSNNGQVDLVSMRNTGALAQFFAIFLPSGESAQDDGITLNPYELFHEMRSMYITEIKKNSDLIMPALTYGDILENARNGKISSLLTIEDSALLDGRIERLDELYDNGVRLMTLLWSAENCLGYPSSSNDLFHSKGLKPFGIEAVKRMNELGILVDVSHLSEGGFYDVAKHCSKPFVASHSCARALCNHHRNLTDDQLKCLGEKGGVVGLNFCAAFLAKDSDYSSIDGIIKHIQHMVSIVGSDHVALGSDFDGIDCRLEIADYSHYGKLIEQLERTYPGGIVENICYKNALRVLKECL